MKREEFKALFLGPEEKVWVRAFDAAAVLLGFVGVVIILYNIPSTIENTLIKFSLWTAVLSMPVLTYTMYRKSDLSRSERLAILSVVLSSAVALLVASLELVKASN